MEGRENRSGIYFGLHSREGDAGGGRCRSTTSANGIGDVSVPRVLSRPSKRGNDSFFPFHPFFPLYLPSLSLSLYFAALLFASRPRMNAKRRQNYCSQSRLAAPLFRTLLGRQLTRNSATQRYTRVSRQQKGEKKAFKRRRNEGERERERYERGKK